MTLTNKQRKEAVRAFRKFARMGFADEQLNPIQIYKRIDVLCHAHRIKIDMLALYDTLRLLALSGDDETLRAVEEVYLSSARRRFSENETSYLVRKYADKNYCDERTVYRRLHKAIALYIKIREKEGLLWDYGE